MWKSKGTFVLSILKVIYLVRLIFQISYLLAPNIEIFLKYFLDKNPRKQPLCNGKKAKYFCKILFFKVKFHHIMSIIKIPMSKPVTLAPMANLQTTLWDIFFKMKNIYHTNIDMMYHNLTRLIHYKLSFLKDNESV